jgi:hypothetical protein
MLNGKTWLEGALMLWLLRWWILKLVREAARRKRRLREDLRGGIGHDMARCHGIAVASGIGILRRVNSGVVHD